MWPFKKSNPVTFELPPFEGIDFMFHGERYRFEPTPYITAHEVALLLPLFATLFTHCDKYAYLEQHNLLRHFKKKDDEV